jgi:hypothetical protein
VKLIPIETEFFFGLDPNIKVKNESV